MPSFNLNHFYYFYEVARAGSFTAAARELIVSQSALSTQVKALERDIGGPLLDRRRGGVDLTEAGEKAYEVAERVFQEIAQLEGDLQESERRVSGAVSIGTVNSVGIYLLPEVLSRFKEEYPDVRINIDFQEAEGVMDLLYQGKVDFALVPWYRKYPELDGVRIKRNKMFLIAPPNHPLTEKTPLSPRDLEDYPFVGYQEGMHTRAMIDSLFKRMSISIEYTIESANAATIKHMVMAGMGLAILPEVAVAPELRRKQLIRLELPTLMMAQEIMLYTRRSRTLSHTKSEFARFLGEFFAPKPRRR